jgi:uncharacterized membrane protein
MTQPDPPQQPPNGHEDLDFAPVIPAETPATYSPVADSTPAAMPPAEPVPPPAMPVQPVVEATGAPVAATSAAGASTGPAANAAPAPGAAAGPGAGATDAADSHWQEIADPEDVRKNKGAAMIGYAFFFIPLIVAEKSRFARFHANQSLVILCVGGGLTVGCYVVGKIISAGLSSWIEPLAVVLSIPFFLLFVASWLASLCLAVVGAMHAFNGEMTELPVIGTYRILK